MIRRISLMLLSAVLISACSTDNEPDVSGQPGDFYGQDGTLDAGPLSDIYGEELAGPQPGSQEDLVVNVGDRVFFGYDRSDLTPEARSVLEKQATWLMQYPNLNVIIEGHADERGTREYNIALGERRASAVQDYLVALGIDASRIQIISYGKERPAVPGANESVWAQNRRSVTVVE